MIDPVRKGGSQKRIITDPQKIRDFIEWLKKNKIQADQNAMRAAIYRNAILLSRNEHPSTDYKFIRKESADYVPITIFGWINDDGRELDGNNKSDAEKIRLKMKELNDFFEKNGKPFLEDNNKLYILNCPSNENYKKLLD